MDNAAIYTVVSCNCSQQDLLLELWLRMRPRLYGAFVPIAEYGVGHTELFVISEGTVVLQQGSALVATLKRGAMNPRP